MKKTLYILVSLFLAAGCGPETPEPTEKVALSIDKTFMEFTHEGGEQTFTVTASEKIYLVPEENWIKTKKGTATDNKTVVTVTVEKNILPEVRQTRLAVVAGEEKQYLEILQTEAPVPPGEGGNGSGSVVPEDNGNLAWQFAERLGLGWNLGNHFDAHNNGISGEQFWGNPKATQATFNKLKAAGFTTVRIPVTWMGHIGEAPD